MNKHILFFYPPKPQHVFSLDAIPENYIFQVKKDGHRVIIIDDEIGFNIYNRYGEPLNCLKDSYQTVKNILRNTFGKGFYLDGEAVGVRQKNDTTDTIVLFDILYLDYKSYMQQDYTFRHNILNARTHYKELVSPKAYGCLPILESDDMNIYVSQSFHYNVAKQLWLNLDNHYDEGLVGKDPTSSLKWSLTSSVKHTSMLKLKLCDKPKI